MLYDTSGYTGTAGDGQGRHAGTGIHQQCIRMSVIASVKLDNGIPAGGAAGQSNGTHGGFCPGIDHTDHLHRRHGTNDQIRQLDLHFSGRPETSAHCDSFFNGLDDGRMAMPQYHRTPGSNIVHKHISIRIVKVTALGMVYKTWVRAHRSACPHRAVDTAGD